MSEINKPAAYCAYLFDQNIPGKVFGFFSLEIENNLPAVCKRGIVSKFEVQLIEEIDARIVYVKEPVRFEDFISFFENELEKRILRNTVWEFEPGVLQYLNLDELKRFMSIRRSNIERRSGGHTILVGHESSEVMLMKWYKSFAEDLPFHDVQFHIAKDVEEAKQIIKDAMSAS